MRLPHAGPIRLDFPPMSSVIEGAPQASLFFGLTGAAVGDIPFSLSPLTYQQFRETTGQSVTDLFPDAPAAASDGIK